MNIFFVFVFIGISLSMDAFSLALVYGTCGFSFKRQVFLSFIVGLFHFFMPLFGILFGSFVGRYIFFDAKLVVGVIFSVIGIEMIFSVWKDEDVKILDNIYGCFLFGFTVSIDSFTTGVGLSTITNNYVYASVIFMLLSGFFTFFGLVGGNYLNRSFGKYATLFGGIIMFFLAFYYIFIG